MVSYSQFKPVHCSPSILGDEAAAPVVGVAVGDPDSQGLGMEGWERAVVGLVYPDQLDLGFLPAKPTL